MDTYEAIMSRRTSHLWKAEPVPEEVIAKALEGAHRAPCHRFTWPWRFVRVSEVHREALFELALELKSKGREKTPAALDSGTPVSAAMHNFQNIVGAWHSLIRCEQSFN